MSGRFSDIDTGLLDRARDLQRDFRGIGPAELDRIVDDIRGRAGAAGVEPVEYLTEMVERADVHSPPNGALFYSGRCPDDPTGSLGNRFVAEAWAERNNAARPSEPVTTLESTPGGEELDGLRLYDLDDEQLDDLKVTDADRGRLWGRLSERYAEQTSGRTGVFATDLFPEAILGDEEVPSLRRNVEVGADNVEFAYPPPAELRGGQPLDPHVRDVAGQPGMQSRLQFYKSDHPKNAYLDPAAANAMSRDDLEQFARQRCDDVDRYDRGEISTPNPSAAPVVVPTPTPAPVPAPKPTPTPTPTPDPDPARDPDPAPGAALDPDPGRDPDPAPDPGPDPDPDPDPSPDPDPDPAPAPGPAPSEGEIGSSADTSGPDMRTADDFEREHDAIVSRANGTSEPREVVSSEGWTADDYERHHDAVVNESFAGAAVGDDGAAADGPDAGRGWGD
jgi:hypothetical protein